MIPSISYNQYEILNWIRELHLDGKQFECDPTYSKGNFYRNDHRKENRPAHVFDLNPEYHYVQRADCRQLPFDENQLFSIIFDPPFLSKTGTGSIIKDRFGQYPSMSDLYDFYKASLYEFARILQPKGILVFKCQNTVMGGQQHWSHYNIITYAHQAGFRLKDEFILLAKNRMERTGKYTQRHARKFHSFFLIFERNK